ncbi:MAG: DOMON domain-containing protein [Candidatus Odinarchaeota archaeon]
MTTFAIVVVMSASLVIFNNSTGIMASVGQVDTVTVSYLETASTSIAIDGVISLDEYPDSYYDSVTEMTAYFAHNGSEIFVGLLSPTSGWVAIGFGPKGIGMSGSNIIIGYVLPDGTAIMEDSYGEGWTHQPDTNNGGFYNIEAFNGTDNGAYTTMEFIFPLSSGDINDHSFFVDNLYGFFLAHHPTADDFTSYHTAHSTTINLYIASSVVVLPLVTVGNITADGIISPGEYKGYVKDPITNISVYFQHNSTDIFVGLVSVGLLGWLGIGFGPRGVGMLGANIIIGYVENGTDLAIQDSYGIVDDHRSDVSNGTTDDIKASAGSEDNETKTTIIEFIYPLNTTDKNDYNLTLGETHGFYLSNSNKDDFVTYHPEHSPTIDLYISEIENREVKLDLEITDGEGNPLADGSSVQFDSVLVIGVHIVMNDTSETVKGNRVNLYSDSTFGLSQIESNTTNTNGYATFKPDLSDFVGQITFIVEFPTTTKGKLLIAQSQKSFSLNIVTPHFEEDPYYWDNPAIFAFISSLILLVAGGVFTTYLFVLYNAGRIFSRKKNSQG